MMTEEPIKKVAAIESPMLGVFYSRGAPDAPPFVTVGSTVRPDTTVCIIEAMKVFTEIPSGGTGTIAEILVEDGQVVEYGQPLFRVETEDPESFQTDTEIDPSLREQISRRFGG